MAYKHGAYGVRTASQAKASVSADENVLYIGTAPINLIRGYADAGLVNNPIEIKNLSDARNKIGYSEDWANYTLNEVCDFHFNNSQGNIGPVYVINVLDPDVHRKSAATEKTLNFVAGKASFVSTTIILDTFAIEDKSEGTDYSLEYDMLTGAVTVDSSGAATPMSGNVACTFYEINADAVTYSDIIGGESPDGSLTGLKAIKLIYGLYNAVVNIIAAPGWSEIPAVYKAMVSAAQKINGHWDAFVVADIPLSYGAVSYNEVTPVKSSNPAEQGWYTHNALTDTYTPSADDHVIESAYFALNATADTPSTNPHDESFYERSGSSPYTYTLSSDTTVDSGKTYYLVTAAPATGVTAGDNPNERGWYELNGAEYELSSDTYITSDSTKVYYEKVTTGTLVDTISKAIAWKEENGYTSEISKVCWPMAKSSDHKYHMSTVATATMLKIDYANDSIPFETASNHKINVIGQFFGNSSKNPGFDQNDANDLNEVGITTLIFWEGTWRLWGGHTAGFRYGDDTMDAAAIFDTNIRMLMHCTNGFQKRHGTDIDSPLTPAKKESIRIEEQEQLDILKSRGALIGTPECLFLENENSTSDMMNGDFVWNITCTVTPQLKSATAKVTYTDEGFQSLFGEE
jgi:phage tail sheath protein FI